MPIHDYRCTSCKSEFELLVRSTTAPQCPHCGSSALERLVSRVAPAGKSAGIIAAGRSAAAREGHFSNYSAAERSKVKR
ncbi:MAG: zinc ribbon domain-containing protein [Burkholderiales bacterium]|nr:zinc ribbon domain-containing protein [Burkholderiales bacterium]